MPADEMLADAKWKKSSWRSASIATRGEEMLSRKSTSRDRPVAVGCNRQGAMDLRASASTVERGIRSRSLRGTVLARSSPSRSYDDDCLRLLAALPHCQNGAEKRIGGPPPQPSLPAVRPAIVALILRPSDSRYPYCRRQVSEKQRRERICRSSVSAHARRPYDRAGDGRSASSTRQRRAICPRPRARRACAGRQ
jgi:hypothetical protein